MVPGLNGKLAPSTEGNGTHGSVLLLLVFGQVYVRAMLPRSCAVRSLSKWPVTFRTGIVRRTRDVSAPSGLHYLMYQIILHFWKIEATNKCMTYII